MMAIRSEARLSRRSGAATVMALLISLMLMVLVSGTMALTIADTETTQDYARNRASFEASDSGVQHGRVQLAAALSSWNLPVATTVEHLEDYREDAESGQTGNNRDISLIRDTATNAMQILPRNATKTNYTWSGGSGPDGHYGVKYNISPTGVTPPVAGDISAKQTFHYSYEIASRGSSTIGGQENVATRREIGAFDVEVQRPSFATYGYFTDSLRNQNNEQLWFYDGETYDGPTHVNTDPANGNVAFWGTSTFNGHFSAVQEAYEDSIFAGDADPQFNAGASWGVDRIDIPQNGWSQLRASIGDLDNIENQSAPTNQQMRDAMGMTISSDPVPPGVYYAPGENTGSTLLGGVFVNGNADNITLTTSGSEQVISITMSSASGPFAGTHTWEIHNNEAAGSSYVVFDGGSPQHFNDDFNGMIHIEGKVESLTGGSGADIQRDNQLTVSATGDVVIDDHITYQDDPRNVAGAKNILGIFSSNGNVYLGQDAPSNLDLHASVMAASTDRGVGAEGITTDDGSYDYTYPDKGSWNLLGGLIEAKNQTTGVFYNDGTFTGYRWNFDYDQRFQEGVAPPYFPYVSKFVLQMMGLEAGSWSRKYY